MGGSMDEEELTPVRALTQYAYCPRLAYMEWVQKEWADNYFTQDGTFTHRRVDQPTLNAEGPVTRSLMLSAPKEGLTCRLDVLEQDGDVGCPVEYKRAKLPRAGPNWPEIVQVAAQALVLRENGWTCGRGYLYYAGGGG